MLNSCVSRASFCSILLSIIKIISGIVDFDFIFVMVYSKSVPFV